MAVPSHWHQVGKKRTLRTTSSLTVTALSVPISEYVVHIHAGLRVLWRDGYSLQLWIERSWVWVLAAVVWCCVLGEGTSPVCTFSQPRSEWVGLPGWTVIACVFEWVPASWWQQACMLPRELSCTGIDKSHKRRKWCEVHRNHSIIVLLIIIFELHLVMHVLTVARWATAWTMAASMLRATQWKPTLSHSFLIHIAARICWGPELTPSFPCKSGVSWEWHSWIDGCIDDVMSIQL